MSASGIHWICFIHSQLHPERAIQYLDTVCKQYNTMIRWYGDTVCVVLCKIFNANTFLELFTGTWKSFANISTDKCKFHSFIIQNIYVRLSVLLLLCSVVFVVVLVELSWWRKVELSLAVQVLSSRLQKTITNIYWACKCKLWREFK